MRAGSGDHIYDWVENWPDAPDSESARNGWSHHGIVVSETGDIYTGHQDDPIVQVFGGDGRFKRVWPSGCSDTHSLTLVIEGCTEYLWIADNGAKRRPSTAFEYPDPDAKVTGQAIKKTLDGEDVMKLDTPLWTPIGRATTSPRGSRIRWGWSGNRTRTRASSRLLRRILGLGSWCGRLRRAQARTCPQAIMMA